MIEQGKASRESGSSLFPSGGGVLPSTYFRQDFWGGARGNVLIGSAQIGTGLSDVSLPVFWCPRAAHRKRLSIAVSFGWTVLIWVRSQPAWGCPDGTGRESRIWPEISGLDDTSRWPKTRRLHGDRESHSFSKRLSSLAFPSPTHSVWPPLMLSFH